MASLQSVPPTRFIELLVLPFKAYRNYDENYKTVAVHETLKRFEGADINSVVLKQNEKINAMPLKMRTENKLCKWKYLV